MLSPYAITIAMYSLALSTLPSFVEQKAILLLFVNYILSIITLNLMLDTMTGKKFTQWV